MSDLILTFNQSLFVITPLNWAEWKIVLALSFPVILIDEVLKLITINFIGNDLRSFSMSMILTRTILDKPARIKTD